MSNKAHNAKSHIKHGGFKDRNISSLESLARDGKVLKNPFSKIGNIQKERSWINECIPNILWACILASQFERKLYLSFFRTIIKRAKENVPRAKNILLTHNFISKLTQDEFPLIFGEIISIPSAGKALSSLLLIDSMPDRALWESHLPTPEPNINWNILAEAVAKCFDHQSERATDIRWFKLMHLIISGRLLFGPGQSDFLESLRLFPNHGDMRQVRPTIRAAEIGMRTMEFGEESNQESEDPLLTPPPSHEHEFWKEVYSKTGCMPLERKFEPNRNRGAATKNLLTLAETVAEHFHSTISTTGLDAKHDGSFGIVLYAINILIESNYSLANKSPLGRMALRCIVESYITLSFLALRNDDKLWLKHRDYGSGQTKLSFLKNLRSDSVPRFINLEALEALANEDKWLEFQDVNLGAWAQLNLRDMATETGLKNIYDTHYDWCSGYSHGHWMAVRDSAFVTCANPLHRFHRIPAPANLDMPSVFNDAIQIIKSMVGILERLYPGIDENVDANIFAEEIQENPQT